MRNKFTVIVTGYNGKVAMKSNLSGREMEKICAEFNNTQGVQEIKAYQNFPDGSAELVYTNTHRRIGYHLT